MQAFARYPEISPEEPPPKQRYLVNSHEHHADHPTIAPQPTDIVITKRRVSAFSEDLECGAATASPHLVLCGIATSGLFLHPPCGGARISDYQLDFALADCCADR